jgi:hypothetical protein
MAHPANLPLRSIESVRRLSQEEAAKRRKVEIEGTILFVYSKNAGSCSVAPQAISASIHWTSGFALAPIEAESIPCL